MDSNQSTTIHRKHLIIIVYAFNPNDMIFSHQFRAIVELAKKFEKVSVLANSVTFDGELQSNLRIYNLRWNDSFILSSFLRLYLTFFGLLKHRSEVIVFSFMTESHAALLGPVTKLLRIKHLLWYAHVSNPLRLYLSRFFVDEIITSTPDSIGFKHHKVTAIGQMVDDKLFAWNSHRDYSRGFNWIHVGRLDPSKNLEIVIETFLHFQKLFPDFRLKLIGRATNEYQSYEEEIKCKYKNQIEQGVIAFLGRKNASEVSTELFGSDIFIHAFSGSLDKTLVEAAFSGISVISVNKSFINEFGLYRMATSTLESSGDLLRRQVEIWMASSPEQREKEARRRFEIASTKHSFNHWITMVTEKLASI